MPSNAQEHAKSISDSALYPESAVTLVPATPKVPFVLTEQFVNKKPSQTQVVATVTGSQINTYKIILAISAAYLSARLLNKI